MNGLLASVICGALGAFLYRWRGGPTWLPAPALVKRVAVAVFLASGALWRAAGVLEPWAIATALAAVLLALAGVSRGHGAYYDLGNNGAGSESDWRWLERWLAPRVPWLPLREGLALAVTGLAATIAPGAALAALGDLWGGLSLAASGAFKAPAYAVGWWLRSGRKATELGEHLTGAAWGAAVGLTI